MGKSNWHKVGRILVKKDESGQYIALGNPKDKYKPLNVKVILTDASGEVVFEAENPLVTMQDPRDNPNLKPGQAEKIPSFILAELFMIERNE